MSELKPQVPSGQGEREEVKSLDEKRKNRSYNPVSDAERGSVSDKLNTDAAKYRKGPGPV
jgi:hypothetical protein